MITGTYSVKRVVEESVCRNSEDDEFTDAGDYKIHATALMPNIPFEEARDEPKPIDASIFINDESTKLQFNPMKNPTVTCQNYIMCNYIGDGPLEFYGPKTKMGREFLLICRQGNPNYDHRVFGPESTVRGYNPSSGKNVKYPKKDQYNTNKI